MELSTDNLSQNAINNIKKWLNEPKYAEYKADVESLVRLGEWAQLEDAFFKEIEFGTGGRRGKTGVGSNRINKVTIGESAQALCEYALSFDKNAAEKGIVIAYDTRLTSLELSRFAAQVVAANGFKAYLFDGFRATPELSFALRHLGCAAGIVISASHNPPTDNGFKAYWSDGGQLVAPHDKGVMAMANKVNDIKIVDYDEAVADGQIVIVGKEIDDEYIKVASAESLNNYRDISIIYSPLHGTGQVSVLPVLRAVGFEDISLVEEQMTPDGNFPTIPSGKPNPEEISANDMAVEKMMNEMADIAITNDPDADRIGVIIRQGERPIYLSGNQSAVLVTDFTLSKLRDKNLLSSKNYIAKTIVTTDMLTALADEYGVNMYTNMLIGFKYIGELILSKENTDEIFVVGGEESYGLLKGTYARDKDGVSGALPLAEYAAELKLRGMTLYDRLLELYAQHGIYVERLDNMVCPGASGFEKMQKIMDGLRKSAPVEICGHEVTAVLDYASLSRLNIETGKTSDIDCASGNVIVLEFGDSRRRITIRPSGTEPKLKFYVQWYQDVDSDNNITDQYADIENRLKLLAVELEKTLLNF